MLDFGLAKLADRRRLRAAPRDADVTRRRTADADVTAIGHGGRHGRLHVARAGDAATRSTRATDIFSFGSVLYEMATGRRAFPGDNSGTVIMRLLKGEFVAAAGAEPGDPRAARDASSCGRWRSIRTVAIRPPAAMLEDLRSLSGRWRRTRPRHARDAGVAAARPPGGAARSRAAWAWPAPRRWSLARPALAPIAAGPRRVALTNRDSILIGSFANSTGETVFDETLTMALKVQLGQSPFLDIVPDDRVAERAQADAAPADERLTHDIAREVCERLGVKAMLDGTLARLGQNYVLTLERARTAAPATRWRASSARRRARKTSSACSGRWPRRMRTDARRVAAARSSSSTCRLSRRRRRRWRR